MGKPSSSSESNPNPNPTINSVTHFSHPHPLQLFNPQTLPQILSCAACKLDAVVAAEAVYACLTCNFALHLKCSQLPQQIQHPFDRKHALMLYPKPVYPEGLFNCDACGHRGAGFSYHCSPCGVDLHTTCASLPMNLTHHCHRDPLALTFSAPYPGNTFSCDICKKLGTKTWVYRCAACEFDVHLQCVATVVPAAPVQLQPHVTPRSFVPPAATQPPNVGGYGGGGGVYGPQRPAVAANAFPAVGMPAYGNVNQPVALAARPANSLVDQLAVAATGGIAQAATQALFQGIFGGGGGGGGGAGGDASRVDVVGMDGGGATFFDAGSFGDGGYGGTDGGFSGGDGSY